MRKGYPLTAVGVVLGLCLAGCQPAALAAAEGAPAQARAVDAASADLPAVATPAAATWTPYAVELASGADWCPASADDDRAHGYGLLNRPCTGLVPRELAQVLLDIPQSDIFLSTQTRADALRQPQRWLALPGRGERVDVMADIDILEGIVIRAFEGRTPSDTVYLVLGPFTCNDDDPGAVWEGEYLVDVPACSSARADTRLYRRDAAGVLRDVTGELLPVPERAGVRWPAGQPQLELDRLTYAPVLRWTARFISADGDPEPLPESLQALEMTDGQAHLGFAVWNGRSFELQQRVPRASWPVPYCDPLRPDSRCGDEADVPARHADRFVDEES